MSTYFITGEARFIKSTLMQKLIEQGNRVIIIDNFCDFYNLKIKENILKGRFTNV